MPSARAVKNQYRGINAHLHSYLQSSAGWNNFHNPHIVSLLRAFKAQLLPMGYTISIEDSLQIRRIDETSRRPRSDLTIYDLMPARYQQLPQPSAALPGGLALPLLEVLEDNPISEKPYRAAVIYEWIEEKRGAPVIWIELLSPSNKGRNDDALIYLQKRSDLVESGLVFVEIDYLHEQPASVSLLPDYTRHKQKSHPYRIMVFEPRPDVASGQAHIYEFDVDDPIPQITLPLSGTETLIFDFNAPYQQQYEELLYGLEVVDYTQFPINFDRYSPYDQTRIANRMLTVLHAHQSGENLEVVLTPLENLQFEEAVQEIKNIQTR